MKPERQNDGDDGLDTLCCFRLLARLHVLPICLYCIISYCTSTPGHANTFCVKSLGYWQWFHVSMMEDNDPLPDVPAVDHAKSRYSLIMGAACGKHAGQKLVSVQHVSTETLKQKCFIYMERKCNNLRFASTKQCQHTGETEIEWYILLHSTETRS